MKLAHASLLGLFLVALGPAPAAHSSWPAVTAVSSEPQLRHAESVVLLARLREDLQAIRALIRDMRGLAALATNGTLPAHERAFLDIRFGQMGSQLDQIAFSSSSSGISILDGSYISVALQVHPALPHMWIQPLVECTLIALGQASQDISTVANANSALPACDMALDSVEHALREVRAGVNAIGA